MAGGIPDRLLSLQIPGRRCRYTARDTILYALAIGFGSDPLDEEELRFVFEDGLKAVPSQVTTLGWDRSWVPASGIDWPKVVHGEQQIVMGAPLPPEGEVVTTARVTDVVDKGSGALMRVETRLQDAQSGQFLCASTTSFFIRGAGGFAANARSSQVVQPWPARLPDVVEDAHTQGNQALLYRLCGDTNPHHVLPRAARAGGFKRPLLHGLCTFGFGCRAILRTCCGLDPQRLASMDARFLAPVFPGDSLRFEVWREDRAVWLRGSCAGRPKAVMEARAQLR